MSVDIEYPLPNDYVGTTFTAGGDYSSLNARPRKGVRILNLPANSKVICTLSGVGGVIDTKTDDLSNQPESGTWEVQFVLPPTLNQQGCSLHASFIVGGVENDNETTPNLTIRPNATGNIVVIPTTP